MCSYGHLKHFLLLLLLCRNCISQPTIFTRQWYKDANCVTDDENILTTMEFILVEIQRLRYDTKLLKDISSFTKTAVVNVKTDVAYIKAEHIKSKVEMNKVKAKLNVIKRNTGHVIDVFAELNRTVSRLTTHQCRCNERNEINQNILPDVSNLVIPETHSPVEILPMSDKEQALKLEEIIYIENANDNMENHILDLRESRHVSGKTKIHVNDIFTSDDDESEDGKSSNDIDAFSGDKEVPGLNEIDIFDDGFKLNDADIQTASWLSDKETETVNEKHASSASNDYFTDKIISKRNVSLIETNNTVIEDMKKTDSEDVTLTYDLVQNEEEAVKSGVFTDCSNVSIATSGVFIISPAGTNLSFPVYCQSDDDDDNGQWLVFQRRLNGDTDFYRNWDDYKNGFGKLDGEFWLGNEKLHLITAGSTYSLRIDMWDWEPAGTDNGLGNHYFAHSNLFSVGNETEYYRMHVPNNFYDYDGFGGSGLRVHAGPFMTYDKHHPDMRTNCAQLFHTGWWFKTCVRNANLNGKYYLHGYASPKNHTRPSDGIFWRNIPRSLRKVEMKLKRVL